MGIIIWDERQECSMASSSSSTWRGGEKENTPFLQSPSIFGHLFIFLAIVGFWKYPRLVGGFDPNRHHSDPGLQKDSNNNPILTPPPPSLHSPPPPPPPRAESSDGDSSCSQFSESIDSESRHSQKPLPHPKERYPYLALNAPESTPAERHRFAVARDGNEEKALVNMLSYLAWRNEWKDLVEEEEKRLKHANDDSDLYDWLVASQTALRGHNEPNNDNVGWQWLPRVARTQLMPNGKEAHDLEGHRIINILPAQIDDNICSLEIYSTAIALYLDRKLDPNSTEKATIILDVRGGRGWRNIPAVRLIPFIKDTVRLVLTYFPERLHKFVIFPLPYALTWVLNAVKTVIDPVSAEKMYVLSGSAWINSPLPMKQITKHVSQEVALVCEDVRLASFSA